MTHRIRHALFRALAHLLDRRIPATGRHRRPVPTPVAPRTASGLRLLVRTVLPPRLPATDAAPVIDGASPLVRPYYLAYELHAGRAAFTLGVAA